MTTLSETPRMRVISLRHLVARLVLLAVSASAVAAGASPSPAMQAAIDDDELDPDLAIDREQLDPRDAATLLGQSLARALAELEPLSATHLAATWALSGDPLRRIAIARALDGAFPLLGDDVVLDHLSRDPEPAIRGAAARAASVRRTASGVLARLADDPDPDVRSIATRCR